MQWKYLAFRWHAAGRCDGSAPLQRTEFLKQHQGRSASHTHRGSDRSQYDKLEWVGVWSVRVQQNTKSSLLLQKGGGRGCRAWRLWLVKHTISWLIMISWVIIGTNVAHSAILTLNVEKANTVPVVWQRFRAPDTSLQRDRLRFQGQLFPFHCLPPRYQ